MGVYHGRSDGGMAQQCLHGADGVIGLQKVGGTIQSLPEVRLPPPAQVATATGLHCSTVSKIIRKMEQFKIQDLTLAPLCLRPPCACNISYWFIRSFRVKLLT
jgi:hypothetical protein